MFARSFALGAAALSFAVAACSSAPTSEEPFELDAAELTAMAVPGVDETALNRAVDPCTDFYEFACGGYVASLPADTQREVRSFSQLQKDQLAVLDRVVDEIMTAPRSDAERKAGAFFKSCMAEDTAPKTTAYLTGFRAEIDAASTPAAIAEVVARMHRRGVSAFFALFATADSQRQGRSGTVAAFGAGYDFSADYENEADRTRLVANRARAILAAEPSLGEAEANRIGAAAVKIEHSLFTAAAAVEAAAERPHPVGRRGLESAAPNVDWNAYFGMLGRQSLGNFPVEGLSYFAALDTLLKTADPADLHAYLTSRWYGAAARVGLAPPAPARAGFCKSQLEFTMSDAIESRFLELAGVDARARAKARALWGAIVTAFEEELRNEPFLDVATRVEAEVKLGKMRGAIASSRRLDDFRGAVVNASDAFVVNVMSLRERDFEDGLSHIGRPLPLLHVDFPAPFVNASYDGSLNKINVPGGILGGYFFSASAPQLANFAAIGSVLGHELTHGFDNNGRQLDGDGVERDWWTPAVDSAFKERSQCLVDQYSAFTLDGVPDPVTGEAPGHVNGAMTLGENIADNGGLKTAYRASKVEGRTSPIVSGFTPSQQFFVGYGQLWCGKSAPAVASQGLAGDPHSPEKARVNLPLANFEAFSSAFQCKAGAPMAPAQRCGVW
jgi:putative endopeptidase